MTRRLKLTALGSWAIVIVLACAGGLAGAQTVDSLTVDRRADASADYTFITITVSINCTAGSMAGVSGFVLQPKSGVYGYPPALAEIACTGSVQDYLLDIPVYSPDGGAFKNGPAAVFVGGTILAAGPSPIGGGSSELDVVTEIDIHGAKPPKPPKPH
jgi:hypothetical protein